MTWVAEEAGRADADARFASLDGLRGIAAMVVLTRHLFNALDMPLARQHDFLASPLAPLLNAQGAVQLFFVLSGFVLSASLARNIGVAAHVAFAARRFFRIQPPYVFALLFAFAASHFYAAPQDSFGLSPWLNHFLSIQVSVRELLGYLVFPGQAGGLLDVGWTLRVELAVSFAIPLLWLAARRLHWSLLLLTCIPFLLGDTWRSAWYVADFALGMVVYLERERLRAIVANFSIPAFAVFLMVALALFSAPMFSDSTVVLKGRLAPGFRPLEIVLLAIGSVGLIVASISRPGIMRLLCTRPIAFLGRISFGLYLLHKTLLHLLAPIFGPYDGVLSIALLFLGLTASSLLAASGFFVLVERPSIRLGKWVGQRIQRFTTADTSSQDLG